MNTKGGRDNSIQRLSECWEYQMYRDLQGQLGGIMKVQIKPVITSSGILRYRAYEVIKTKKWWGKTTITYEFLFIWSRSILQVRADVVESYGTENVIFVEWEG